MTSLIKLNKVLAARNTVKTFSRSNYFFVLPEVPSDTAETNALMRNDPLPAINELDYKKIQNGFQKLAITFDNDFNKLVEDLSADKTSEKTFDHVFPVLEKSFAQLDYAFKTARHLAFIAPYSKSYLGFAKIQTKMGAHKDERWTNKNLYKLLKELESRKHIMSEQQNNLVERTIRYCKLNGLHFNETDQATCTGLNNKLTEHQSYFKQRLNWANKTFELRLAGAMPMDEIPMRIKQMIAHDPTNPNKGPWSVIPNEDVFRGFMKYCSNRGLRRTFYEAFYSRASYINEQKETNNSEIIKKLVAYRKDLAKLFEYQNYAQMAIESKAAVSVDNVAEMINKIKTNLKPVADESLARLQKFSANEGNLTPFEGFDVEFWRTKYINTQYKVDPAKAMQYFPLNKVLTGLFDLAELLFNVEFRKDESVDREKHLWNSNVSTYAVFDENGKQLSTLFIDPFLRSRKINNIWSYAGRDSSLTAEMKPIAYLMLNASNLGQSTLLSFEQVKAVFSEFGKVLQILLTQTPFVETSDHNSVESDAFGLSRKLFDKLLFVPEVMNMISAHVNTGDPMPADMLKRLKQSEDSLKVFQLMTQTYLSAFDLECHMSDKFWPDIADELWPKFMPFPMNKNDFRACQFESSFAENFGALYYSHLWSDMLAADLYEAFNDVGFANKTKIQEVGRRFRDTFLVNGSSLKSNEMFRQFRGRNPSIDPFIKSYLSNDLTK